MVTSAEVVACARQYVGVRFAHQGRSVHGLDCLGLLLLTAETLRLDFAGDGFDALDIPNYGARPDVLMLRKKLDAHLHVIDVAQIQPADVVLLKIDGSPQHLGLIADYPFAGEFGLIHAYAPARMVVEHRYDADWKNATYLTYRLPQLIHHQN